MLSQNNALPAITSLTLQLAYPWFHLILPLLTRDGGVSDALWFPALTTLTLLTHRSEGRQHRPTVTQYIEEALIESLGIHSQRHQNTSLMQNLFIQGLAVSEDFARQLRSLVDNVTISGI